MKVILNEYVPNLGEAGIQVVVADGYARNYLLPRKLAIKATSADVRTFENNMKQRERKLSRMMAEAEERKASLEAVGVLEFVRKTGEKGKLFGSVTSADIVAALAEKGHEVDKRKIALSGPIKSLGESAVYIKLHPKVNAKVKVMVSAEPPPAEPAAPVMEAAAPPAQASEQEATAEGQEAAKPESGQE